MKILICGATNYGNMGDDCIRDNMINHIVSQFPTAVIKCTRPYPQKELVEWADKVIIGGGGILYDDGIEHSEANFDYFIKKYLQWAIELHKPVCLCSVGFQKLELEENINLLRNLLKNVSFISVRQQKDYDFFIQHNLKTNIILADDLGFLTPKTHFTFTLTSDKPKVCLIPHHTWLEDELFLQLIRNYIIQHKNVFEFYLTTSSYEDNVIINELFPLLETNGSVKDFKYLKAPELVSFLGEMDYVLTSRFHCAIFAHIGNCKKILGIHKTPNDKLDNLIFNLNLTKSLEDHLFDFKRNNSPYFHLKMLNEFLKIN